MSERHFLDLFSRNLDLAVLYRAATLLPRLPSDTSRIKEELKRGLASKHETLSDQTI